MDEPLLTAIRLGLTGSVFALKLAQALPFGRDQLALIPRERDRILRALVAMDLVVPLVALVVILVVRPGRRRRSGWRSRRRRPPPRWRSCRRSRPAAGRRTCSGST